MLKFFRNRESAESPEGDRPPARRMAGNDANPGGGPSRIGTLHEQTPLLGGSRCVAAEGSR